MTNIKLRKIYVDGYKNLIECETEVHDFNVLVGPNNSGKTNFLELFAFVNGLIRGSKDLRKEIFENASTPRGDSSVCQISGHVCKPIKISFLLEDSTERISKEIKYSLAVQCTSSYLKEKKHDIKVGFISEELSIKDRTKTGKAISLIKRKGDSLIVKTKSGNPSKKRIDREESSLYAVQVLYPDPKKLYKHTVAAVMTVLDMLDIDVLFASAVGLRGRMGKGGKSVFYKSPFRVTSFDLIAALSRIRKESKLFKQFKGVLCQILDLEDARFVSVKVPENLRKSSKELPNLIHFFELKLPGQSYSSIENFSDGTIVVTAILVMLLSPERKGAVFCIEEPENCLHPKALKTLISYLLHKSKETQIFVTTHSSYILNLIDPNDVIISRVYKDGGAHFERIGNIRELRKRLAKGYISFGDLLEAEFKEGEDTI